MIKIRKGLLFVLAACRLLLADASFATSSAITFLSFDSLGEKYVLLMSNLKVHSFSL